MGILCRKLGLVVSRNTRTGYWEMTTKKRPKLPVKHREEEETPHHVWKRRKREALEALEQELKNDDENVGTGHGEHDL